METETKIQILQQIQNTLPESLQIYSPKALTETFAGVTTVRKAIATGTSSMLTMSKKEGSSRKSICALIKLQIIALDLFLKQKDGLTREEVDFIAESIFEEYGEFLNFADIHIVFRNAKLGRYGQLYGQLSAPKIMSWFEEYDHEKTVAFEHIREEEAGMFKRMPTDGFFKMFGYKTDSEGKVVIKDGRAVFDEEVLKRREAAAKAKKGEIDAKEIEYRRFKNEQTYMSIINKPEEQRSQSEKDFVEVYEATMNIKKQ